MLQSFSTLGGKMVHTSKISSVARSPGVRSPNAIPRGELNSSGAQARRLSDLTLSIDATPVALAPKDTSALEPSNLTFAKSREAYQEAAETSGRA